MKTTFQLKGMTCSSCEAKIEGLISEIPQVKSVIADKGREVVLIDSNDTVSLQDIQSVIEEFPKYSVTTYTESIVSDIHLEEPKPETFKPLIIIAGFITLVSLLSAYNTEFNQIDWMNAMRYFMAGFFIVFSFFKFLDLKGFADSYQMYDILAAKSRGYAFVYPFIELGLGLLYLTNLYPFETNLVTAIIMGISIIGVIRAVTSKTRIQCACLGSVFNLPMTTVTIIEDGIMIVMAVSVILWNHI